MDAAERVVATKFTRTQPRLDPDSQMKPVGDGEIGQRCE
jgi:hypothetical protein